jgi:hypothetical protein
MAQDTFDGDGALSANWTVSQNAPGYTRISGAAAPGTGSVESAVYWNADTFAANQYAQATIQTVSADSYVGVGVRISDGGNYYGYYGDPTFGFVVRVVGGTYMSLISGGGFANGNVIRLEVEGSTLRAYIGSTGSPGLISWANNNSGRLDNWIGNNLFVAPPPFIRRALRVRLTQ